MNRALERWIEATHQLAEEFISIYFPDAEYQVDTFWAGDEVGDVFFVNDYFFDLRRMIEVLELEVTVEQLFGYHELEINHAMSEDDDKRLLPNFRNYVKFNKEK